MFKRILILLLSILLVTVSAVGFVSCESKDDSGLTVLTDVKGIPDAADDALDKNNNGINDSGSENDSGNGNQNSEDGSGNVSDDDIIINKSSKKIHLSYECRYAGTIKESNKLVKPRSELESYLENGYSICSNCNKNYQNND
ncbi:MAG: hypothetical protein E7633_03005 [Ruminococcaceae bacterium]|nr:hypothetical protein [Oscillospiraceae bacterium]